MIDAELVEGGAAPIPQPPAASGSVISLHTPDATSPANIAAGTCPAPDEVIRLPLGSDLYGARSETLMKTGGLELIRLVVPAGREIPTHQAPSELTVQCLEGCVSFTHDGSTKELRAGDLIHLCPGSPHSAKGLAHSSLLVTLRLPRAAMDAGVV
jgi:quercetin dioxygenase-like cupin family protein